MRLIDADRLKEYINDCDYCRNCKKKSPICTRICELPHGLTEQWERIIDEQPTIKAGQKPGNGTIYGGVYEQVERELEAERQRNGETFKSRRECIGALMEHMTDLQTAQRQYTDDAKEALRILAADTEKHTTKAALHSLRNSAVEIADTFIKIAAMAQKQAEQE